MFDFEKTDRIRGGSSGGSSRRAICRSSIVSEWDAVCNHCRLPEIIAETAFCPRCWSIFVSFRILWSARGSSISNRVNPAFETMSKRRRGYPSETHVKRGVRVVDGEKLLVEKLGRNDLCPCGSGQRFKKCCLKKGCF